MPSDDDYEEETEDNARSAIDQCEVNHQPSGHDNHAERFALVRSVVAEYAARFDQGTAADSAPVGRGLESCEEGVAVGGCAAVEGHGAASIEVPASIKSKESKREMSSLKRDISSLKGDDTHEGTGVGKDSQKKVSLPIETREEKKRRMDRLTAKKKRDRQKIEIEVLNDERLRIASINRNLDKENREFKQAIELLRQMVGKRSAPSTSGDVDPNNFSVQKSVESAPKEIRPQAGASATTSGANLRMASPITTAFSTPAPASTSSVTPTPQFPTPHGVALNVSRDLNSAVLDGLMQLFQQGGRGQGGYNQNEAMGNQQQFANQSTSGTSKLGVIVEALTQIANTVQQNVNQNTPTTRQEPPPQQTSTSRPRTSENNASDPVTYLANNIIQSLAGQQEVSQHQQQSQQQQLMTSLLSQIPQHLLSAMNSSGGPSVGDIVAWIVNQLEQMIANPTDINMPQRILPPGGSQQQQNIAVSGRKQNSFAANDQQQQQQQTQASPSRENLASPVQTEQNFAVPGRRQDQSLGSTMPGSQQTLSSFGRSRQQQNQPQQQPQQRLIDPGQPQQQNVVAHQQTIGSSHGNDEEEQQMLALNNAHQLQRGLAPPGQGQTPQTQQQNLAAPRLPSALQLQQQSLPFPDQLLQRLLLPEQIGPARQIFQALSQRTSTAGNSIGQQQDPLRQILQILNQAASSTNNYQSSSASARGNAGQSGPGNDVNNIGRRGNNPGI